MKIEKNLSLLDLLHELRLATPIEHDRTTLRTIVNSFEERGFAVILFFLALPAALPIPAIGLNIIIAFPILLLTLQQISGRHRVWLPEKVKNRTIKTRHLHGFIDKSAPLITFIERFVSPRLYFLSSAASTRLIGLFGMIFALSITLPVPLTNTVPAMAIALMSIGIILRDGLAVILGMVIGTIWIGLLVYVVVFFGTDGIDILKEVIKGWLGLT